MKHHVSNNIVRKYGFITPNLGFTLAEVLITLGIVGVVAALTIPTLISKYKVSVLESQFKKAYSVVQNVNLMMKMNDINPYEDYRVDRDDAVAVKQINDFARFTQGARVCDGKYYICTIGTNSPDEKFRYKTLDGKSSVHIDPDAYTKKTVILPDGATVWVGGLVFGWDRYYYDINGTGKGPNKLGYDLHVFTFNKDGYVSAQKPNSTTDGQCSFVKAVSGGPNYGGFTCTHYAISNTNPDKEGGKYWGDFIK